MSYEKLIINILERYDIEYWTEGKNVSEDSINIQCPFYSCGDHSNHLGIFKNTLIFNCWKCHKKGHFSYLLKILTGMTDSQCTEEIENEKLLLGIKDNSTEGPKKEKDKISPLPQFFEKVELRTNFPLLNKYLKRRKLSLDLIVEKGCGVCRVGPYMNRLIIPVFHKGEQVSFAAADMTGSALVRYHFPGHGTINEYLYGYDETEKDSTIVVTEGILDQWKTGDGSVAIFGSYLSDTQKMLLIRRRPSNLIFCMDGDAYWHAKDISTFFEPFVNRVEVVRMDFEEDPDSLGTDKIWKLIENKMFSEEEDLV